MRDTPPASAPRRSSWKANALGVLVLAAAIGVLHGPSISFGLFLDDHAHYRQLREADWTLRDLVDACHLELVGGVIDLWWLPQTTLRFFRPVSFGLMKLTYALFDWDPRGAHVASLLWHFVVCILLSRLLRRAGASRALAWFVAILFAIHPAHVATVQWIASQSELMVTAFCLAALLCFARFRRWNEGPANPNSAPARKRWAVASVVFFALALGCRENAVVLPIVVLLVDCWIRRGDLRRAAPVYCIFAIVCGGYLLLRSWDLGGAALPPRPYVVPPTAPDFLPFVFNKACYYLLGEFLLVPCVPIGGLAYLRGVPAAFYGLTLLVVVPLAIFIWRGRTHPAAALGVVSLLGFMTPVLPAFESPHHLYLPGIGAAILVAFLLSQASRARRPSRVHTALGRIGLGLVVGVLALVTHFSSLAIDAAQRVESRIVEEIASAPRPVRSGDTLYIANLPMVAHYVQLALEERLALEDLRVVALTWAPRLLGVLGRSELRFVDRRTIEVSLATEAYFSGPIARLIREAHGKPIETLLADRIDHADFVVELGRADERGIHALRFRFRRPLDESGIHLFWGSRTRWAAQVTAPSSAAERP